MNIQKLHKNWTELAAEDPLWVVLTDPAKRGNKWDEAGFLETGRQEIAGVMEKLAGLGLKIGSKRALDFGCGAGRLSQALASYFEAVDGVDVSSSMIEKAMAMNKFPDRITFHLNVSEDLSRFPASAYDFVYSNICLQHIPPRLQVRYIADFVRLLKPGSGIAAFHTIHAVGWRQFVPHGLADCYEKLKNRGKAFMPLYGLPLGEAQSAIGMFRGDLRHRESHPYAGWESRYTCDFHVVSRA